MKLTEMERKVLEALYESSEDNGHDFGCIEDARGVVGVDQLGAIVSNLVKKGLIEIYDSVTTDSGTWTQFAWCEKIEGCPNPEPVRKLLESEVA